MQVVTDRAQHCNPSNDRPDRASIWHLYPHRLSLPSGFCLGGEEKKAEAIRVQQRFFGEREPPGRPHLHFTRACVLRPFPLFQRPGSNIASSRVTVPTLHWPNEQCKDWAKSSRSTTQIRPGEVVSPSKKKRNDALMIGIFQSSGCPVVAREHDMKQNIAVEAVMA